MKRWLMLSGVLTTTAFLATGLAFGQPKADCKDRAQTPEKVEGQVVAVDQSAGRVTIREKNGSTHEFQAEEHTSELQSRFDLVCRLLLEKKKKTNITMQASQIKQK